MLSLLKMAAKINEAADMIESKNYYYERHECIDGAALNVKMDYKLKDEIKGEIIKFGFCPVCNICYYHNDFESGKS